MTTQQVADKARALENEIAQKMQELSELHQLPVFERMLEDDDVEKEDIHGCMEAVVNDFYDQYH